METMTFAGVRGEVVETSPHGSFMVLQLSERVWVCGSPNNKFNWMPNPDEDSGFAAFLLYVGVRNPSEITRFRKKAETAGAMSIAVRKGKRTRFPQELRIDGLDSAQVSQFLSD